MNTRNVWMILLVLAVAMIAAESISPSPSGGLISSNDTGMSLATCEGMDGHCFEVDADFMMDMDSPSQTRLLRQMGPGRQRYITYQALRANSIPCGWRGNSYYDCDAHKRVNPYRRGCTAATRCFRYTH
ncbi:unnamed protein product [Linum trigynum]|uniref:Uncharacterized protein n=1 Tax=Linum trigynum TaxID=586398 RepID=A0AAV2FKK0_9ROSI